MKDEFVPINIKIKFRFKHPSKGSDMNFHQCKAMINKIALDLWEESIKQLLNKYTDQLIGISINQADSHPGSLVAKVR